MFIGSKLEYFSNKSYQAMKKIHFFHSCLELNECNWRDTNQTKWMKEKMVTTMTATTVVALVGLKQNGTLYNRYPVEMVINQFARGKSVSAASFKTTRAKDKIQIVCLAQLFVQDRVSAFCRIFLSSTELSAFLCEILIKCLLYRVKKIGKPKKMFGFF